MSEECYSLLKPRLYGAEVPRPGEVCTLSGGRCGCGHVFYPWQSFGCERCGAAGEALSPFLLSGRGHLLSSARVRRHQGDKRPVPFTVVTVKLEEGPIVRTLLSEGCDVKTLSVGTELQAVLELVVNSKHECVSNDQGHSLLDLRFEARELLVQGVRK